MRPMVASDRVDTCIIGRTPHAGAAMRPIACLLLALAIPTAHAQASDAQCAVWQRELSFGDALAAHDHAAFAAHLHSDAVFGVSDTNPTRGRDAIAKEWKGLIDGTMVRLAWYPTHVVASGDGSLAWSTGPSLIERVAATPEGETQPRIGSFQSVWQRDGQGAWHVLFDGGTAPKPATPAEVEAFHAGRQRTCPAAAPDTSASRP